MPLRPRALSVGALLVCGACSSFGPPPPELIRSLDAVDPPRAERALASVTIESEDFSGTFQCALARRRAPAPAVRMKLYSDLGGAVIDLVATTERVTGRFAQTGIGIDWDCGRGDAPPRSLLAYVAASLLEETAGVTAGRVVSARRTATGWVARLAPVVPHVRVAAVVSTEGELLARRFEIDGVKWSERRGADIRYEARGVRVTVSDVRRQAVDSLPDRLFELELDLDLDAGRAR